ncbi:MAG: hypothetical protein ACREYE_15005 [Gammaproteobacteria bacterium]
MHAKYASIEFKGEVDNKHYVISAGKPITREEWLSVYGNQQALEVVDGDHENHFHDVTRFNQRGPSAVSPCPYPAGISKTGGGPVMVSACAVASATEEPDAENCTSGSVREAPGNRRPYRGDAGIW